MRVESKEDGGELSSAWCRENRKRDSSLGLVLSPARPRTNAAIPAIHPALAISGNLSDGLMAANTRRLQRLQLSLSPPSRSAAAGTSPTYSTLIQLD